MATRWLLDMGVLSDSWRDCLDTLSYVEVQQERLLIPMVTVIELSAGVREGEVVWPHENSSHST